MCVFALFAVYLRLGAGHDLVRVYEGLAEAGDDIVVPLHQLQTLLGDPLPRLPLVHLDPGQLRHPGLQRLHLGQTAHLQTGLETFHTLCKVEIGDELGSQAFTLVSLPTQQLQSIVKVLSNQGNGVKSLDVPSLFLSNH